MGEKMENPERKSRVELGVGDIPEKGIYGISLTDGDLLEVDWVPAKGRGITGGRFFVGLGATGGLLALTGCVPPPTETPTPIVEPTQIPPPPTFEITPTPEAPEATPTIPAAFIPAEFLPAGANLELLPAREIEGYRVLATSDGERSSVAKVLNGEGEQIAFLLAHPQSYKGFSPEIRDGLIYYGEQMVFLPWIAPKETPNLFPYPALNRINNLVVVWLNQKGERVGFDQTPLYYLSPGYTARMNFEAGYAQVGRQIIPIWGEPPTPTPTPTPERPTPTPTPEPEPANWAYLPEYQGVKLENVKFIGFTQEDLLMMAKAVYLLHKYDLDRFRFFEQEINWVKMIKEGDKYYYTGYIYGAREIRVLSGIFTRQGDEGAKIVQLAEEVLVHEGHHRRQERDGVDLINACRDAQLAEEIEIGQGNIMGAYVVEREFLQKIREDPGLSQEAKWWVNYRINLYDKFINREIPVPTCFNPTP